CATTSQMLPSLIPSLSAVDSPVSHVTTSASETLYHWLYGFDTGPPGPPASRSSAEQPQVRRSFHECPVFASSLITVFTDSPDPTTAILLRCTCPAATRIKTASIHSGIVVRMTLGGLVPSLSVTSLPSISTPASAPLPLRSPLRSSALLCPQSCSGFPGPFSAEQ
ncbi:hypothetical protein C8F01DRAFT_1138920, partial [Mycena amicta]